MRVPWTGFDGRGEARERGTITISQCSDLSTRGRNFSKNAMVSAGVLYIFPIARHDRFLI